MQSNDHCELPKEKRKVQGRRIGNVSFSVILVICNIPDSVSIHSNAHKKQYDAVVTPWMT